MELIKLRRTLDICLIEEDNKNKQTILKTKEGQEFMVKGIHILPLNSEIDFYVPSELYEYYKKYPTTNLNIWKYDCFVGKKAKIRYDKTKGYNIKIKKEKN